MDMALIIRTYWKDLDWLHFCLRSIERYCRGFAEVVIAVPEPTRPWMPRITLPRDSRLVCVPKYADDYLGQQITKLYADRFTNARFIAHVDADCIFVRTTHPEDLAPGDRPRVATRPIAQLGRHYPWQRPTEAFLGFAVDRDFMQQPPFVYPRWIYPLLRRHCVATHGLSIDRYVAACPPRGFSEFNALGAYAYRHHCAHFDFADASSGKVPAAHCDWHWSWGGITAEVRRRIDTALDGDAA